MSQTMMRVRIAAQGFTVAALVVGVMATLGADNFNQESSKK